MAYYTYKEVRDLIPDDFSKKYIAMFEESYGREYNYDSNYDGDMWSLTAAYIESLQNEIKLLKEGKEAVECNR